MHDESLAELFPVLQTERLILRKLVVSDWEQISFLRSDTTVNKFVQRPNADTQEKALAFISNIQSLVEKRVSFYWAISLKNEPSMIGSICLWHFSNDRAIAEVGYDLDPKYHKMGMMSEALESVLDYGFTQLKLHQIEAFTHRDNLDSKNLLLKSNFILNLNRTDEDNLNNHIFELMTPLLPTSNRAVSE